MVAKAAGALSISVWLVLHKDYMGPDHKELCMALHTDSVGLWAEKYTALKLPAQMPAKE